MRTIFITRLIISAFGIALVPQCLFGQNKIAISIDDVPNTRQFQSDNYRSVLLNRLDSLHIPISIFVNEGLIYKTDSVSKNFELLVNWVKRDYTTLGNHTFSHSRYSEVGYNHFKKDIERGESILRELANKYKKPLHHFRFPYNDLGKDSLQHVMIDSALDAMNYISTPFTVESSDWMFNYIYEYYLEHDSLKKAREIGEQYVSVTLDYIHFIDTMSQEKYSRKINQIYLCHDNALNRDYIENITNVLKKEKYTFISIDEALEDPVYHQAYKYYRKWGVSWLYRWMPTQKERVKWMRLEPDMQGIELLFEHLNE